MTNNLIAYQKTIVLHKTDVNKYFRIKNKFYRIFKVTKNHVHYAECYLEKDLKVPNIRYGEKKAYVYLYFASDFFTGDALYETKTMVQNKIYWNSNKLYNDITDLYLISKVDEDNCYTIDVVVKEDYKNSAFNTAINKLFLAGHLKSNLLSLYTMSCYDGKHGEHFKRHNSDDKRICKTMIKLFLNKIDIEFTKNELCTELEKYQIDEVIKEFKLLKKPMKHDDHECPVCLDIKTVVEGYYDCNHEFCTGCISKWELINPTCPLCRSY
jgi:hypothetical protein